MKKILFIFAFLLLGATAVEAQLISYSQTTRIKQKKKLKPVEPGYQQTIAFTTSLGCNYEFFPMGVVYEGGYRINNTFYLGAGVGFLVAMVMFAGVRQRLESCDIPKSLKGLPITLVAASLVSLSFLGFTGLVENMLA